MIFVISINGFWIHFLSELVHLLFIEIKFLSSININWLILRNLSLSSFHMVGLWFFIIIFGKSFSHNHSSFSCLWTLLVHSGIHSFNFWHEKLIWSYYIQVSMFKKWNVINRLTCSMRTLLRRLLCAIYIFNWKRLTELSLYLEKSLWIRPEVERI